MAWYNDIIQDLFKRKVPETEVASIFRRMDLDQFFNSLNNLWSPNELIEKIGGWENLEILYKDQDIYAAIDKRIAALLTSKMMIEGPDPALVKFFEEQLRPHERQLKQDFWWTIFNGYGVEQIIYNEDMSGRVRGFQREQFWRFEPQKDLIHVKLLYGVGSDADRYRNQVLPYGKWVLTTNNGTSFNPIGDSMAERLITPWIFKCNGWDLWQDFAKRFANGFMHAQIEDMEQRDEVRAALEKAGKSSIIVTDKNSSLTLHQANRDSSIYTQMDERTVRAIQKVILGETQTSDMAERGSSGSAGVQNEVRQEKTWADIDLVEKGLNEIIAQIAAVNGFDLNKLPKAILSWDPDFSIEQVTRDQGLYGMGVRFTPEYYKKTYGLSENDFSIKEEVSQPWGFKQRAKSTYLSAQDMKDFIGDPLESCHHKTNLDATTSRLSRRQENEKEEIVDLLIKNNEPPLNPDDLIAAIMTAENEKDLDLNLNALFDTRNNGFVDTMTKALYLSAARGAMLGNPEVLNEEE